MRRLDYLYWQRFDKLWTERSRHSYRSPVASLSLTADAVTTHFLQHSIYCGTLKALQLICQVINRYLIGQLKESQAHQMIESLNATELIDRSLSSIIELFLKLNHLTPVLLHRPIPGSGGGRQCRCGSQQQPHLRQPMGSGQCLFFLRDNHHNNR